MENDKNCSTNHVAGFWGQNLLIMGCLKVWEVWKVLGRPKVTKFSPEYFWAVLMENDNNYCTNDSEGFWG